jgi:glycosyltransferase involved in cell wall biosynthesis
MTPLATMNLGIPEVATKVGGNPEIVVPNKSGFLVANDQQAEFSAAMTALAADAMSRKKMGLKAETQIFSRFASSVMADNYRRLSTRLTGV